MLNIEEIFKYKIVNTAKLLQNGFTQNDDVLKKQIQIMKNKFTMNISINTNTNAVNFTVIDNDFGEEYILVNAKKAHGIFVEEVRTSCEKVLTEIAQNYFDTQILKENQTKRILSLIDSKYNVKPEFLWKNYPDFAAFRRKDNQKWFALILTIDKSKLKLEGSGNIECINLKAEPSFVETMLKQNNYYPAYHMNKKHWYTVWLNDTIPDEQLESLLEASFVCSAKK